MRKLTYFALTLLALLVTVSSLPGEARKKGSSRHRTHSTVSQNKHSKSRKVHKLPEARTIPDSTYSESRAVGVVIQDSDYSPGLPDTKNFYFCDSTVYQSFEAEEILSMALAGDGCASYIMAMAVLTSDDTEVDPNWGVEMLDKAINDGCVPAMTFKGAWLLQQPDATDETFVEALVLLSVASSKGDPDAEELFEALKQMLGE